MDLVSYFAMEHADSHSGDVYPPGPEHPWCGNFRARRLSGAAVGHNRVHLGEAITISGFAGFGLGTSVVVGYRERLLVDGGYTAV